MTDFVCVYQKVTTRNFIVFSARKYIRDCVKACLKHVCLKHESHTLHIGNLVKNMSQKIHFPHLLYVMVIFF